MLFLSDFRQIGRSKTDSGAIYGGDTLASVAETSTDDRPEGLRLRQQWLKRALAGALIIVGLFHWAAIVGLVTIGPDPFADASGAWQWAIINLAAAYLVAAVGLWLLTSWGVVIWIYAAVCELAMSTVFAGTFGFRVLPIAVQVALLSIYAALALAVRRAEAADEAASREERLAVRANRPVGSGRYTESARERIAQRLGRGQQGEQSAGEGSRPAGRPG